MKKAGKLGLVTAASLVVIGLIIFCGVMCKYHWDFHKLSTGRYETNIHRVEEEFRNLAVITDTADITFVLSDDGKCRVECYEEEKAKHFVSVEDDTLVIQMIDEKSWYDYIGINFNSPKITVYLPKDKYTCLVIKESTGDIELPKNFEFERVDISLSTGDANVSSSASGFMKIKTSTGKIRVKNVSVGALELSASTGSITVSNAICKGNVSINISTGKTNLNDITCRNLSSEGDTGDISLYGVLATEKFSIHTDTGDVKFDLSDAAEIFVETDTGDVVGNLLTDKVFIAHTDTGKVDVPKAVNSGKCEIHTDTGDIKITIEPSIG